MAQITIDVPSGKNWKTTACGAVTGIGAYMAAIPEPQWVPIVGKALVVAGPIMLGFFAKDSNVTGGTVTQDQAAPVVPAAAPQSASQPATP